MECLIKKQISMDYLRIVLDGYCNEITRKHLADYFIREALNAKDKHYSKDEFIDGCKGAVSYLQKFYHDSLQKQKDNYWLGIEAASLRAIRIQDGFFEAFNFPEYCNKSYDEQCEKLIEIHKDFIKDLDLNNYWQPLNRLNMGYMGDLTYNDTLKISYAIAQTNTYFDLKEIENKTANTKEPDSTPLQFKINLNNKQLQVIYKNLVSNGFLQKDTTESDLKAFIYILGGNSDKTNFKYLEWKSTKSLLAYFVDKLCSKNKKYSDERTSWKWAENCFQQTNLRGARNDYDRYEKPKGSKVIDTILEQI